MGTEHGSEAAAFSPQLLQLATQAPHPLPRVMLGLTALLVCLVLLWATLCKVDIVAVAQGKLVPQSALKIVQSADNGVVRAILVQEGELVKKGQVLLRMDPTMIEADLAALRNEWQLKSLALRRIDAELAGQTLNRLPTDPPPLFAQVAAQHRANVAAMQAAIAQERANHERALQEAQAALATRQKLEQTAPHYREQEAAFAKLAKEGYAGSILAGDKNRERIEKEHDLRTQSFILAREKANMALSEKRIAQLQSDYQRQLRAERSDVADRVHHLQQELAKQDHRHRMLELRAPQDGKVKDLATHTIGTVVQSGTILLTLVPNQDQLNAEVWLQNDDIGQVLPQQEVKLKLGSFPFQKYGMVDGRVMQVAADASERQDGADTAKMSPPLAYRTTILLARQHLHGNGTQYPLSPGMQVTAEIKLGERTILEYLFSPVRKIAHEAMRERG